jgi:Flp pilus assembly protein TadD
MWLFVLAAGLSPFSGGEPSKEQQAIDALNRGVAHARKREFDEAIAEFTEAIQLNPEEIRPYCERGLVFFLTRRWPP